jgi:hypothetical protein
LAVKTPMRLPQDLDANKKEADFVLKQEITAEIIN